ncbi:PaaI family thioesterase [Promicromonospora sp. Populi]|uniref:PaaI family thioesterase n=1 Tax=Promicromonospora sp. Populi TaxID=3239420 RepID=UPI0034E2A22F
MSETQQSDAPTSTPGAWGEPRTRELTWYDPQRIAAQVPHMSGVEFLGQIRDGILAPPPITEHFGLNIDVVEEGRVTFVCRPDESCYNPIGTVHGGVVCTLLDTVCGCAMQSVLPQGKGYTSIEIKVNYLKAVRGDGGLLTAEGTVTKAGSRVGFTEGVIRDASGTVVATASSTLLIFDIPTPRT